MSTADIDRRGSPFEILVLDDEDIVCSRLKPMLTKWGYKIETYMDSLEALDRLAVHEFDVVVTDLKMAGADGMEVFRFVKEKWPDTEVILITGFATVEITREALQSGVRDIIAKPFKCTYLKELIEEIAEEKRRAAGSGV